MNFSISISMLGRQIMFVVQLLMSLGQGMSDGVPLFHQVTQLNGCECISGNVPIFVYMLFAHH